MDATARLFIGQTWRKEHLHRPREGKPDAGKLNTASPCL